MNAPTLFVVTARVEDERGDRWTTPAHVVLATDTVANVATLFRDRYVAERVMGINFLDLSPSGVPPLE